MLLHDMISPVDFTREYYAEMLSGRYRKHRHVGLFEPPTYLAQENAPLLATSKDRGSSIVRFSFVCENSTFMALKAK